MPFLLYQGIPEDPHDILGQDVGNYQSVYNSQMDVIMYALESRYRLIRSKRSQRPI